MIEAVSHFSRYLINKNKNNNNNNTKAFVVEKPVEYKCYADVIVLTCDPSALK